MSVDIKLLDILGLILITLKLMGYITVSWFVVLLPFTFHFLFISLVILVFIINMLEHMK